MTGLIVDLRSVSRQFLRHRGLTAVALMSLSVGIGVSVAIMTVSSAVVVKPLPYERPEELVMIWGGTDGPSGLTGFRDEHHLARQIFSPNMVLPWKRATLPFTDFALFQSWETDLSARIDVAEAGGIERLRGTFATANLFSVLGVRVALGRTFTENETGVVVISDDLWRRRFAADPGVLGKTMTIAAGRLREHQVVQIIGVLPERFHFTYPEETEMWLPLTWSDVAGQIQVAVTYRALGRLRSDTTIQAAEAAMQAFRVPGQRNSLLPERIWLEPMHDYAVGRSRQAFLLVSALTVLVLVSGAINAATVFAASTVSRLRDIRVRRALGASQAHLIRMVFTETAAVAIPAGALGVIAVSLAVPGLRAMLPATLPRIDEIRLDSLTLAGVCGSVVLSTLLAGLTPALLSVRDRAHHQLEDTRTATLSRSGLHLRTGLLGVQFVLVTALLIAGGMLVRSFWRIMHVEKGFEAAANVYVAEIQLIPQGYRSISLERELLRRVRELSYVEAAGMTSAIPLRGVDFVQRLRRFDGEVLQANIRIVDPGYFDVMRIPLISGRWLTDADMEPVALVSQSLAAAVYPGVNPLGKELWGSGARIVGVVADVRARSLMERPLPAYYVPRRMQRTYAVCLLVRTGMAGRQVAADLRRLVQAVYPEQPIQRFATMQQVLDDSVSDRRAYAVISSAFGITMLLLSGLGLCGHLSHVVAERRRDLAIRSVLGATPGQQLRLLIRQLLVPLLGGISIAIVSVCLLFPFAAGLLFEIDRFDGVSYAMSALLVSSFTAAAMFVAARRVAKADPAGMLRSV